MKFSDMKFHENNFSDFLNVSICMDKQTDRNYNWHCTGTYVSMPINVTSFVTAPCVAKFYPPCMFM